MIWLSAKPAEAHMQRETEYHGLSSTDAGWLYLFIFVTRYKKYTPLTSKPENVLKTSGLAFV